MPLLSCKLARQSPPKPVLQNSHQRTDYYFLLLCGKIKLVLSALSLDAQNWLKSHCCLSNTSSSPLFASHMSIEIFCNHHSLHSRTLYHLSLSSNWHLTCREYALTTLNITLSVSSFKLMILSHLHNTTDIFFLQYFPYSVLLPTYTMVQ